MKRFWEKVKKSDSCWVWTGSNVRGYGSFRVNRRVERAHRVSWMLHHGQIPRGIYVLHRCDNPSCVRPSHLFLGTQVDNVSDMYSKGRHGSLDNHYNLPSGINHHFYNQGHKISRDQAQAIRKSVETSRIIAEKYGISASQVRRIKQGIHWK